MKSTYTDNFLHKIMLVPPAVGGKSKKVQPQPIVLCHARNKGEADKARFEAEQRFAKRPGRIVVIPPSGVNPHVGRNHAGKFMVSSEASW